MTKIFLYILAMCFVKTSLSAQVDKHKIAKYIAADGGIHDYFIALPIVIKNNNEQSNVFLVGKYYSLFNLFSDTISESEYPEFLYNLLVGTRKEIINKSILDQNWQYFKIISSSSQCKQITSQEFDRKIAELNATQSKQGYINVSTDHCIIKDMFDRGIFIGSEDESGLNFIKTIQ